VRRWRDKAVPLALTAAAYALAFAQSPGYASSDTKIDLHVDPGGFLGEVTSLWAPTGSLGHVQGAQHGGYLFPMGPFFAALHGLGLSPWVVQRLWLGTLLALAAWGVVRLLDATLSPRRGIAHVVAGAVVLANPYVIVFANRTSVFLLGYAALPWALYAAQRGLREPRGWRWAALIGLITSASGGGVNAASVAWVVVAPLLLALYEAITRAVARRDAMRFALRMLLAVAVASIWWLGPVVGHALYGIDFLRFTEQAGTIWGTTSLPESLRLMGYWISYLGVGFGGPPQAYFSDAGTLLFNPLVVTATLLVPALAISGLAWTRRWRYAPFFLLLLLAGLLFMAAGFPDATPLRRALAFAYERNSLVQALRTTYKAGPLVAVAVACLAGAAFAELAARLRTRTALGVAGAGALALIVLSGWPLFTGDAIDRQLEWKRIPPAWTAAARDLDRGLPRNERAVVLPGQPFAFYRWGGTVDPILPALTKRPVAVRNTPPYADTHAVDMLWTVDGLVQQRRLVPGQLPPLLDLMAAGAMVTGSDDRYRRSGAAPPADAALALADQPGARRPAAAYGPRLRVAPAEGELGAPPRLPEVRRADYHGGRGIVRVEPAGPATVVDGSAEALAGLAAFGAIPRNRPVTYAGDFARAELRRTVTAGAELVISDSNRRRVVVASRARQTTGATLGPDDPLPSDGATLNPFSGRGSEAQTVALYPGLRSLRAPESPGFSQFPEQRPFAAFDGSVNTAWEADQALQPDQHWIEARFERPRALPYVDVLPLADPRARVTEIAVAGRRFRVRPGWNRFFLGLRRAGGLRIDITNTDPPSDRTDSAGGLAEVRVPGLRVRELLRPPRLARSALAGADLSRSGLTYLFERTTADLPFRRDPDPPAPQRAGSRDRTEAEPDLIRAARDPERRLGRVIELPVARNFQADAWVSADPAAPDSLLDRLARTQARGATFGSSSRFHDLPSARSSRAFDGDPRSGWVGAWTRGRRAFIAWRSQQPTTVKRLRLVAPAAPVRAPTRVRLHWPGGATPPLRVLPGGVVALQRAVTARSFRLELLAARYPAGTPRALRTPAAVGIGELRGAGVPSAPRTGPGAIAGRCGDAGLTVDGRRLLLQPRGTRADLEAGRPLRARGCGAALALRSGRHVLHSDAGRLLPYLVRLRSPAPAGLPPATGGGSASYGRRSPGHYDGMRVDARGPSWLVLGESWNKGWRARCDGRSLGEPRVIDGFANGWGLRSGCREASFTFVPQFGVLAGYALGALACLILLAVVLAGWLRARRRAAPGAAGPMLPRAGHGPARLPAGKAVLAGLVATAVLGFVFALRAGVVIGPALALLLWRGVGERVLILAAGALLVVALPLVYLLFPADDRGGYNTEYAIQHLGAHWVTVAAVTLLGLALWRMVSRARGLSDAPAAGQAAEGQARSRA
jgi:arabinofuranan 3-O-arabinosyltransferase